MASSPLKEIPFGEALKISLDNYYDLLKAQVGGLGAEEYLQLKLVADTVDISDKKASERGYPWNSYFRLLQRSDVAVEPTPVVGAVATAGYELTQVYSNFLRRLRRFVVRKQLTPEEQIKVAQFDTQLDSLRQEAMAFAIEDRKNWRAYADAMGYEVGDLSAYVQWSGVYGHLREIETRMRRMREVEFDKKTILERAYPDPDDRRIVDAEFAFDNPAMRLRYPIHPDFEYPNGDAFNLAYLALLPLGSTALFEDRHAYVWDKTINFMKTDAAGHFDVTLDRNTAESRSIQTEWKASGSGRYGLFKARVSASEQKTIEEDFRKGTKISLSAKAAFKVAILYPTWFDATLFNHKRVRENIHDFRDFFGEDGTLLYFPTHLIFVRGFAASFTSAAKWTFDYQKKFSASAGGGFNIGGISFGASGSYSSNEKEHKVDQTETTLTIADGENTLRFVGYAVKKNNVFIEGMNEQLKLAMGEKAYGALR